MDLSPAALEYAQKSNFLGDEDSQGNKFLHYTGMDKLTDVKIDAIISVQVFEHISDYKSVFDHLWDLLATNGIFILLVPVKGWRDSNHEHVNKFTIKSMFDFLSGYSDWVSISPRTYSDRSGRLNTAYFYIEKK